MIPSPLQRAFEARFGGNPAWVIRSPGRVNLIGEHTDYNQGFVLPMAIPQAVWLALRPRADGVVKVASLQQRGEVELPLRALPERVSPGWGRYVLGVALALREAGVPLVGWEGVLWSDLPVGAGLSSSAALEMALLRAFSLLGGWGWEPLRMAQVGQRAEWLGVGVACGLMDQLTVAAAQAGHALWLDCRTFQWVPVPLPPTVKVVVLDTGTRRRLQDGAYNRRRESCQRAAEKLGVASLREVSWEDFQARAAHLTDEERRRARHVITENERVVQAVAALRAGDLPRFGALMNASHRSLREDFEVSTPYLDAMVEAARAHPACYGARLTGAGFGGCAVAVVVADAVDDFLENVAASYSAKTGMETQGVVCEPVDGVSVL